MTQLHCRGERRAQGQSAAATVSGWWLATAGDGNADHRLSLIPNCFGLKPNDN